MLFRSLAENAKYTFADYLGWDGPQRYELINGEAYLLASPSFIHQEISAAIHRQLLNFLEGKKCRAIAAPFDVRLFEQIDEKPENVDTIVQPDISIICDKSRVDDRGYRGVPEMIIEILSPSSARHDKLVKFNLYQQAGLKEYWIVDPMNRAVSVFLRDDAGRLVPYEEYGFTDVAKVNALDGCFIELNKVFPDV